MGKCKPGIYAVKKSFPAAMADITFEVDTEDVMGWRNVLTTYQNASGGALDLECHQRYMVGDSRVRFMEDTMYISLDTANDIPSTLRFIADILERPDHEKDVELLLRAIPSLVTQHEERIPLRQAHIEDLDDLAWRRLKDIRNEMRGPLAESPEVAEEEQVTAKTQVVAETGEESCKTGICRDAKCSRDRGKTPEIQEVNKAKENSEVEEAWVTVNKKKRGKKGKVV